ncbi:uncharacterized protein RAG0_12459 [Rhynchosporium agropyri]|uniref:Uncharacterized protein n=1 Tax=Rhynchosporium agropyri TaxID=914238 RepID=A0A1E1L8D1_9HELO|nr:uncharacterized protein RAG0_12459 [Rhynchosporium agropyri]
MSRILSNTEVRQFPSSQTPPYQFSGFSRNQPCSSHYHTNGRNSRIRIGGCNREAVDFETRLEMAHSQFTFGSARTPETLPFLQLICL